MNIPFLRRWRYLQFNSELVRKLLSLYFRDGMNYRVLMGPLRGSKLLYDRTVNFHAILGLWELESYRFLARVLRRGKFLNQKLVIADVGANIGLFSLWASRLVKKKGGRVYAFEPAPPVLRMLKNNLRTNKATNVEVVECACSDKEGTTEFFIGNHHHQSSLLKEWAAEGMQTENKVTVATTSLDHFFESHPNSEPDFIKVDIEGGGVFALKAVDHCIRSKRPLIWIESHTPDEDRAISNLLVNHQYEAYRMSDHRYIENATSIYPDPKGVWGTMLLYPMEKRTRVRAAI